MSVKGDDFNGRGCQQGGVSGTEGCNCGMGGGGGGGVVSYAEGPKRM